MFFLSYKANYYIKFEFKVYNYFLLFILSTFNELTKGDPFHISVRLKVCSI